ncbi:EamA family transporter [Escherichia coli]
MSRKDGVLALLVVVVWGLNFVVIKVGLHNMPPLMLAGLRFMLVAFPAIFFVARPKVPLNLLLGYGLTISFAQFAFLFCAINFGMPAGLASLVLQAQAFFTIVLGAFTTIVGYGIWGTLLGRYETWRVAPLSLLVPVVGLASAALLLDERLTGLQFLGAVLIMTGLYINVFGLRWRKAVKVRG